MKKVTLFLLSTFFFACLNAQEKNAFQFSFNHQALSVSDVQKSAAFYSTVMGLEEITNRTQITGIRWFSLGEGKELHLVSILPGEVKITKAVHFALATPQFENFLKNLESKKVLYSDWPGKNNNVTTRADGVKQIYLQDPDGYWIEVNSVAVK
jgi:lactoylglutathione lyase